MSIPPDDISIGIDLGTSYCCVGVWRNDRVEIIPNNYGNRITPSYLDFSEKEICFGDGAKNHSGARPLAAVFGAQRLLGRKFTDPAVQDDMKYWPFKVCAGEDGGAVIEILHDNEMKIFTPEQILSLVLKNLKNMAGEYLGKEVKHAVVTAPAHFDYAQRLLLRTACEAADLYLLRTVHPTSSTTLALFESSVEEHTLLVIDIGAGTCEVSVLAVEVGVVEEITVGGLQRSGGDDFDNCLLDFVLRDIKCRYKTDLSDNVRAVHRLRLACERLKRTLSYSFEAYVEIDALFKDGRNWKLSISRATFEDLCADTFNHYADLCEKVLHDSAKRCKVTDVVLVGGSIRIPKIKEVLSEHLSGKVVHWAHNLDEAPVHGAAKMAGILSRSTRTAKLENLLLLQTYPFSFGIEIAGGIMCNMVKRITSIPCKKTQTFSTNTDYQSSILIQVYEGERNMTRDNSLLQKIRLDGIPPMRAREPRIHITFEVVSLDCLIVSATEESTGNEMNMTISKVDGTLPSQQEDSFDMAIVALVDKVGGQTSQSTNEQGPDVPSPTLNDRGSKLVRRNLKQKVKRFERRINLSSSRGSGRRCGDHTQAYADPLSEDVPSPTSNDRDSKPTSTYADDELNEKVAALSKKLADLELRQNEGDAGTVPAANTLVSPVERSELLRLFVWTEAFRTGLNQNEAALTFVSQYHIELKSVACRASQSKHEHMEKLAIAQCNTNGEFYCHFLAKFRSLIFVCETLMSGMVASREKDMRDFAITLIQRGVRTAAKNVDVSALLASAAKVVSDQNVVPGGSVISSLIALLTTLKGTRQKQDGIARVAFFAAKAQILEGMDGVNVVIERISRYLVRARRMALEKYYSTEKRSFGRLKKAFVKLLSMQDNTPQKECAEVAAIEIIATMMKPHENSKLFEFLQSNDIPQESIKLHEMVINAVFTDLTIEDIRSLEPFSPIVSPNNMETDESSAYSASMGTESDLSESDIGENCQEAPNSADSSRIGPDNDTIRSENVAVGKNNSEAETGTKASPTQVQQDRNTISDEAIENLRKKISDLYVKGEDGNERIAEMDEKVQQLLDNKTEIRNLKQRVERFAKQINLFSSRGSGRRCGDHTQAYADLLSEDWAKKRLEDLERILGDAEAARQMHAEEIAVLKDQSTVAEEQMEEVESKLYGLRKENVTLMEQLQGDYRETKDASSVHAEEIERLRARGLEKDTEIEALKARLDRVEGGNAKHRKKKKRSKLPWRQQNYSD